MRQKLREWTERIIAFLREVIFEERPGTRESLLRALL